MFRKKGLPYPEGRAASSEYLKGRRNLPEELLPSKEYKKAVVEDIKSRIEKVGNPDIDIALKSMDAADLKTRKAYEEAIRLRKLQKELDIPELPKHHMGKINAVDKIIQQLGFEKIPNVSEKPSKKASDLFSYLQKNTMKVVPGLGALATGLGALGYSDMAGAATDAIIPGGIEEMGISPEQAELDRKYKERIRQFSKGK